jgi:hypothetical protein
MTLLPRGAGIHDTPQLGFCIAEGAWHHGWVRKKESPIVALGTRLIACTLQVKLGFRGGRSRHCVVMPTVESALASPLCKNPAWRKAMFLPLADPLSGELSFTFIAYTNGRKDLIHQLIAATGHRAELGVRALPIVELSREPFNAVAAFDALLAANPARIARVAALLPPDAPPPEEVDEDIVAYHPALPIVGWTDQLRARRQANGRRDHESTS